MISDPRLAKPIATLIALSDLAETLNDPCTSSGSSGAASGKPESSEPGHQQCPWLIEAIEEALNDAVAKVTRAHRRVRLRDPLTHSEREAIQERKEAKEARDADLQRIADEHADMKLSVRIGVVDGALRYRNKATENTGGLKRGSD